MHIHWELEAIARRVALATALVQHVPVQVGSRNMRRWPCSGNSSGDDFTCFGVVEPDIRIEPRRVQALGRVVARTGSIVRRDGWDLRKRKTWSENTYVGVEIA
jgi:hypothetical protein